MTLTDKETPWATWERFTKKPSICQSNMTRIFMPMKNFCLNIWKKSFVVKFIVALHINTALHKNIVPSSNQGISQNASDFRYWGVMKSFLFLVKNKMAFYDLVHHSFKVNGKLLRLGQYLRFQQQTKNNGLQGGLDMWVVN